MLLDGSQIRSGGYYSIYIDREGSHVQVAGIRAYSGESTVIQPVASFERFANIFDFGLDLPRKIAGRCTSDDIRLERVSCH